MDFRDIRLFPCRKIGVSNDGLVTRVDYEFLYIKDNLVERRGLPLQYAFDDGWELYDCPKTASILYKSDIEKILELAKKSHAFSREEVIHDLVDARNWATDTLITEGAIEFIAELEKELEKVYGE